jgi:hypothetical protein
MGKRERRAFAEEFKAVAVRLTETGGRVVDTGFRTIGSERIWRTAFTPARPRLGLFCDRNPGENRPAYQYQTI